VCKRPELQFCDEKCCYNGIFEIVARVNSKARSQISEGDTLPTTLTMVSTAARPDWT